MTALNRSCFLALLSFGAFASVAEANIVTLEITAVGSGIHYSDGYSELDQEFVDPGLASFFASSYVESDIAYYADASLELSSLGSAYVLNAAGYTDIYYPDDEPSAYVENYFLATLLLDAPMFLSFYAETSGEIESDTLYGFEYSLAGYSESAFAEENLFSYEGFAEGIFLDAGSYEFGMLNAQSGHGYAETYISAFFTPAGDSVPVPDSGSTVALSAISLLCLVVGRRALRAS